MDETDQTMSHQPSPVGSGRCAPADPEPTPAGEPLLLEIGDRAFLHAEKYQRDERWWRGEWAKAENRRRAGKERRK